MNQVKYWAQRITGIIIAILNLLWTSHWIWLFYGYHFTNIFWFFMYPNWVLVLNIVIGLIGVYIGLKLIRNKMSVLTALIIDIPVFLLGLIVSHYVPI